MSGNYCLPIPRGIDSKQYLAKHSLLSKITLTSDMTEKQIFTEISSVFNDSFGGCENFKFLILQSTGGLSKSLMIPKSVTIISGLQAVLLEKMPKCPFTYWHKSL